MGLVCVCVCWCEGRVFDVGHVPYLFLLRPARFGTNHVPRPCPAPQGYPQPPIQSLDHVELDQVGLNLGFPSVGIFFPALAFLYFDVVLLALPLKPV